MYRGRGQWWAYSKLQLASIPLQVSKLNNQIRSWLTDIGQWRVMGIPEVGSGWNIRITRNALLTSSYWRHNVPIIPFTPGRFLQLLQIIQFGDRHTYKQIVTYSSAPTGNRVWHPTVEWIDYEHSGSIEETSSHISRNFNPSWWINVLLFVFKMKGRSSHTPFLTAIFQVNLGEPIDPMIFSLRPYSSRDRPKLFVISFWRMEVGLSMELFGLSPTHIH